MPATQNTAARPPEIIAIDEDLALAARTMRAAAEAARPPWKAMIDRLLDRRLELMRRAQNPQP